MLKFRFIEKLGGDYESLERRPVWLVGVGRDNEELTKKMFEENIWHVDKGVGSWRNNKELIKSIKAGEYLIAKSTYKVGLKTLKERLQKLYDNTEDILSRLDPDKEYNSVMFIKAIGRVIENPMNGESLKVQWIVFDPCKEWFFNWYSKGMKALDYRNVIDKQIINFAFYEQPQNFEKCLRINEESHKKVKRNK